MSAAWPLIVDRLLVLLPALPGWADVEVFDGPPVTQDAPADYVTVGFVVGRDDAGNYEQTRNGGNGGGWQGALEETGTVVSEVVCSSGDTDIAIVRDRAFALVDAWEAKVSEDERLGILPPSSTSSLSVDVQPINRGGASQRLTVTLSYFARGL